MSANADSKAPAADPDRHGGRRHGRCRCVLDTAQLCAGDRRLRRAHRLGHRRRRHADAVFRVPDARQPQAGSRCRRLRLCAGRLRALCRLLLGVRLLGQRLRRQRVVLDSDQVDARRVFPRLGTGQYDDRGAHLLGRHMGISFSGAARREGGGGDQQDRHGRQDHPAIVVRRVCRSSTSSRRVRRQPLGRQRPGTTAICSSRSRRRCW